MTNARRDRPVAICARCRAVVRSVAQIGRKCARPLPLGKKCPGVIQSAIGAGDWLECPVCLATGRVGDGDCSHCRGEGWICVMR